MISHKTLVRKWAVEDLNVAYPIDRLKELEAEGTFKRLAHTNVSMVGSLERYTELVEQTVPAIKAIFDAQGVDLVLLAFLPGLSPLDRGDRSRSRSARSSDGEHQRALGNE